MIYKLKTSAPFVLSLVLMQLAFAGDAPVNNVVQIGGADGAPVLTLPPNNTNGTFTLFCRTVNLGKADPAFKNGLPYQVPAAKTLEISQIMFSSATGGDAGLVLSDSAPITSDQALNTLTAPYYMASDSTLTNQYIMQLSTAYVPRFYNLPITVGATRYVGCSSSAAGAVHAYVAREVNQ